MNQPELSYILDHDCNIVPVGKRRNGGARYWCLNHKSDATAKFGKRSKACRYAELPPLEEKDIFKLNIEDYPGGVALWGAVPPIYDTTEMPLDKGIHVHARKKANGTKDIDQTFRKVQIIHDDGTHEVSELDAIYYLVSSIFGFDVKLIHCTHCGYPHLDKDWFCVHPHQLHLCAGCGKSFRGSKASIGNPIAAIQKLPFTKKPKVRHSNRILRISQETYPGGIKIWGSNPSILWTSDHYQEWGIHVHAFKNNRSLPEIDDTYNSVEIDGIKLHGQQVGTYMAQQSLPHIANRIRFVCCSTCNTQVFDTGSDAFEPYAERYCSGCKNLLRINGKFRKIVANPIVLTLELLAKYSIRTPQVHDLGLITETP